MTIGVAFAGQARGTVEDEESFGQRVKKFLAGPTPTPRKHRKKPTPAARKKTPAPTPSPSPSSSPTPSPSPSSTASPSASSAVSPEASASTSPTSSPAASEAPGSSATPRPLPTVFPGRRSQSIEPVQPISPGPRSRRRPTASPTPEETPESKSTVSLSASPEKGGTHAATATISANEIVGYDGNPANVRKILDLSLGLTNQNLGYKYGSADPANGAMDCSGFIYYVLSQSGIKDPPRDAREQYIWVRKAGNFQAVLGHSDETFELDALKPGDLLFWSGTYAIVRDPDITHTMIYLGREKGTNRRVMVGASDGRTYKGQSRFGVSVFDFKIARSASKSEDKPAAIFVGYGRIPDLPNE
jgi:cell wall-associated NlpC family hydrolase